MKIGEEYANKKIGNNVNNDVQESIVEPEHSPDRTTYSKGNRILDLGDRIGMFDLSQIVIIYPVRRISASVGFTICFKGGKEFYVTNNNENQDVAEDTLNILRTELFNAWHSYHAHHPK